MRLCIALHHQSPTACIAFSRMVTRANSSLQVTCRYMEGILRAIVKVHAAAGESENSKRT